MRYNVSRLWLLIVLLLPACVSAQSPSGPISSDPAAASCAAADYLWLEQAAGDTKSLTCSSLAASTPFTGAYLLLDASNSPVTGNLEVDGDLYVSGAVEISTPLFVTSSITNTIEIEGDVDIAGGDFTVNAPTLFVDESASRIGIGTITPSFKLHIVDAASPALLLEDTTTPVQTFIQSQNGAGIVGTNTAHSLLLVTGGTAKLTLFNDGSWKVACLAAAPFPCNSGGAGRSYCDSTTVSKICFCNGTSFVPNDSAHTGDCT